MRRDDSEDLKRANFVAKSHKAFDEYKEQRQLLKTVSEVNKSVNRRQPIYTIGEITAANSDGTYDVCIKGRDHSYPSVVYIGVHQLAVGDIVTVGFEHGDKQLPFIVDASDTITSKEISDEVVKVNRNRWPSGYFASTIRTNTQRDDKRAAAFIDGEEINIDSSLTIVGPEDYTNIRLLDTEAAYSVYYDTINSDVILEKILLSKTDAAYTQKLQSSDPDIVNLPVKTSYIYLIGVNRFYLYLLYNDLSNVKHIVCVDKSTLELVKDLSCDASMTYDLRMGDTYVVMKILNQVASGQEYLNDVLTNIYGVSIRFYKSDLSEYIQEDPQTYRYIPGSYNWIFGGPGMYPAVRYNSTLPYDIMIEQDRKFPGAPLIAGNSSMGSEWLAYTYSNSPVQVSRNCNMLSDGINLICHSASFFPASRKDNGDEVFGWGAKITCWNQTTGELKWTKNGTIDIANCAANVQFNDGVTQTLGSATLQYFSKVTIYHPIAITDAGLIAEEITYICEDAAIPQQYWSGLSLVWGTCHFVYVKNVISKVILINLENGITLRELLSNDYDKYDKIQAYVSVSKPITYEVLNTYTMSHSYNQCARRFQVISKGYSYTLHPWQYGSTCSFKTPNLFVTESTIETRNDGAKADIWISRDLELSLTRETRNNWWKDDTVDYAWAGTGTTIALPLIIQDNFHPHWRINTTSNVIQGKACSLVTGAVNKTVDLANRVGTGYTINGLNCVGLHKLFFNATGGSPIINKMVYGHKI